MLLTSVIFIYSSKHLISSEFFSLNKHFTKGLDTNEKGSLLMLFFLKSGIGFTLGSGDAYSLKAHSSWFVLDPSEGQPPSNWTSNGEPRANQTPSLPGQPGELMRSLSLPERLPCTTSDNFLWKMVSDSNSI